jgi:hypothetical protein
MNNLSILKNRDDEAGHESLPPTSPPVPAPRKEGMLYDLNDDKYGNIGYHQAIENRCNLDTYQLLLNHVLRNVETETYDMRDLNSRKRSELEQEMRGLQDERVRLATVELPELQEKLKEKKSQFEEVQRDPSKMPAAESAFDATREKMMQAGLFCLTIFLYCFYFLTGHAAFMKNIGKSLENSQASDVSALFETVFDASAVVNDLTTMPLNVLLIAFFPFIFIVTGYLVHHFMEKKQYGGMAGAIAITVGLDFAIAYKVTSKMFDARRLAGLEEHNWHFSMIFGDVNFYLILLAGMAVYVLWGILLGLFLDEKGRGNRITLYLEGCRRDIVAIEADIRQLRDRIAALDKSIRENMNKLAQYDEPGTLALLSWRQIEQILNGFTAGWSRGIHKFYQEEQERLEREKNLRSGELLTLLNNFKTALKADPALIG